MKTNDLSHAALGLLLLLGVTDANAQQNDSRVTRRTPVVEVFERNRDAVVNIAATQVIETTIPYSLFDEFFGIPPRRGRTERYTHTSIGSGFIIHPDGYVVTNAHVVVQAAALKVIFADKTEHQAERVAIDEKNDLAILKIKDRRSFPAVTLGRSDDLMTGETVIAIGNPLGYQHTVTSGIISATNRTINIKDGTAYEGLIQTDASINRGNSGGPLLNMLGELIGINTAIRGDAQNIGFAIPVDRLREQLPEMLSIEKSKRWKVGLQLGGRKRVYVAEVSGPAKNAGIQLGDELVSIDGKTVKQEVDYYIHLLSMASRDPIEMKLKRGGKLITATVRPQPIPIPDGGRLLREKFGMSVRLLSKTLARDLDLKGGLIITDVEPGSPADQAGIIRGLIIVQIGKYYPSDLDDVGLLLERVEPGDKVWLRLWKILQRYIQPYKALLTAR